MKTFHLRSGAIAATLFGAYIFCATASADPTATGNPSVSPDALKLADSYAKIYPKGDGDITAFLAYYRLTNGNSAADQAAGIIYARTHPAGIAETPAMTPPAARTLQTASATTTPALSAQNQSLPTRQQSSGENSPPSPRKQQTDSGGNSQGTTEEAPPTKSPPEAPPQAQTSKTYLPDDIPAGRNVELDAAVTYLVEHPSQLHTEHFTCWLKKEYPGRTAIINADDACTYLKDGQAIVNMGLLAGTWRGPSPYFRRAILYFYERQTTDTKNNITEWRKQVAMAIVNTALRDFEPGSLKSQGRPPSPPESSANQPTGQQEGSSRPKTVTELSDPNTIVAFENTSDISQTPPCWIKIQFERAIKQQVTALSNGTTLSANGNVTTPVANDGQSANPATDTNPVASTTVTGSTVATDTSSTSQNATTDFFQQTSLNLSSRATVVQEELTSGYVKIFGRMTIGYKLEGTLPIAANGSTSTSSTTASASGTTSSSPDASTPSTTDYVTTELLMNNGGLLNLWFSPLQLTQAESPQGVDGRQYEPDTYYLAYFWNNRLVHDKNDIYIPGPNRYDASSLLLYIKDGVGFKAYQQSVGASTTSSVIPSLLPAEEAYLGLGLDGPTFTGLASTKQNGYLSLEGLVAATVLNRVITYLIQ